jgi:GNAT superfamily N-acetyltransferase
MPLPPIPITPQDPESPAAKACLRAYFALLVDRVPGITAAHVPDPDPEADAFRPPHGTFLMALSDGQALACVSLKRHTPATGEVKRLWVDPAARGLGLARRMMTRVEEEARLLGFSGLILDTNAALTEAIALYRATGWQDTEPYTGFPATHWFAKAL